MKAVPPEVVKALAKDWQIAPQSAIREVLAARIAELLLEDFPRLANAFYRLDVDEEKTKAILKSDAVEQIPEQLADLVIEREVQKYATRLKYANKGSED